MRGHQGQQAAAALEVLTLGQVVPFIKPEAWALTGFPWPSPVPGPRHRERG